MVVIAVREEDSQELLSILRNHPKGEFAQIIGRVSSSERARVVLRTAYGTKRLLEAPSGELLPRIC
jgi:hydrogenase expression/formation protein HypE